MYGWGKYGLAGDYYTLLRQANLQDCDPMDSACVSNNVAKQAAVEDLWVNNYMTKPGGVPDDVVLNFAPQTAAEVREFYNPLDLAYGGNVVDTRGIMQVGTKAGPVVTAPVPVAPATTTPAGVIAAPFSALWFQQIQDLAKIPGIKFQSDPVPVVTKPAATSTPAGKVIVNSSGPEEQSALPFRLPDQGGVFSALPWWAWLGGAGLAFYALKGKH